MKWLNDRALVSKTPFVTTLLLENANVQQLWQMWRTRTAAGQSLWGWMMVGGALWLWCNFYRVICPKEKAALRCTQLGVLMNLLVILTVIWFRYGRGR